MKEGEGGKTRERKEEGEMKEGKGGKGETEGNVGRKHAPVCQEGISVLRLTLRSPPCNCFFGVFLKHKCKGQGNPVFRGPTSLK
jgi:hypothetical protein